MNCSGCSPWTTFTLYPFGQGENRPGSSTTMLGDDFGPMRTDEGPWIIATASENLKACHYVPIIAQTGDMYREDDFVLQTSCFNSTTQISRYFDGNQTNSGFGSINGTVTTCSYKPCAKYYTNAQTQGNGINSVVSRSTTVFHNTTGLSDSDPDRTLLSADPVSGNMATSPVESYCADGEETCQYSWSMGSMETIGTYMKSVMTSKEFSDYLTASPSTFNGNFTALNQRYAEEISYLMSTSINRNATNITGTAYGIELYVRVQWLWLILPICLLTVSISVLILSIISSLGKPHLLKNKILAAIFVKLDGWEIDEDAAERNWDYQSMKKLEERSKGMFARLQRDAGVDAGIKLKKE
jgi:hypothetical protein